MYTRFVPCSYHIINIYRENKWKKRGICCIPTKYGIAYHIDYLNQAGCLIQIYTDGNVLLCTGAVEMGQGVFTKMIQVFTVFRVVV